MSTLNKYPKEMAFLKCYLFTISVIAMGFEKKTSAWSVLTGPAAEY